ncbi:hypothetical protein C5167_042829 [Papaver somniferum]|uniref:Uncharacterized protein n=1 Tax=Papaver somniferum TaxID=3469 RepID=A0A4Y7L6I6_PAPSO|nr:hypothetical protein C5167_042829 [Papaver somniferum]
MGKEYKILLSGTKKKRDLLRILPSLHSQEPSHSPVCSPLSPGPALPANAYLQASGSLARKQGQYFHQSFKPVSLSPPPPNQGI